MQLVLDVDDPIDVMIISYLYELILKGDDKHYIPDGEFLEVAIGVMVDKLRILISSGRNDDAFNISDSVNENWLETAGRLEALGQMIKAKVKENK